MASGGGREPDRSRGPFALPVQADTRQGARLLASHLPIFKVPTPRDRRVESPSSDGATRRCSTRGVRGRHRERDLGARGVRRLVRCRSLCGGARARRRARRRSRDRVPPDARHVRHGRDRAHGALGGDRARHDRERVHVGVPAASPRSRLGRPARADVQPPARGHALRGERPRGGAGDALGPLRRPGARRRGDRAALRARPRDAARRRSARASRRASRPVVLGRRPLALPRAGRVRALRRR